MWIKSASVLLCVIVATLAGDENKQKKKDDNRGKRNLQYSIAHHYSPHGSQSFRGDRRIATGSQVPLHPPPLPGPRPNHTPYYKGRPHYLPIPPYAVQMEPLVHYSQRDPLYDTNVLSINTDTNNDLGKVEDLHQSDTNLISDNTAYGPPLLQHHTKIIEKPVYIKEPEPIIEIIIRESNVTLPPQPQIPITPPPKKKEEVQVFYVKYKKNPNGYGKDSVVYDKPVPAISPPIDHEEEQEPQQPYYLPEIVTSKPPVSTTLRTIIRPDSEVYHSPTGNLKVTFGKESFDYSKRSSKADDFNRESSPRQHTPFSQGRQLHSFPPNYPKGNDFDTSSEYRFESQRIPQPYRPFNQPNQSYKQNKPNFNRPPPFVSQLRFPFFQSQPPQKHSFSRQPLSRPLPPPPPAQFPPTQQFPVLNNPAQFNHGPPPRQPVPYQPFENIRPQNIPHQPPNPVQFRPETHFPFRQHVPLNNPPPTFNAPFNNQPFNDNQHFQPPINQPTQSHRYFSQPLPQSPQLHQPTSSAQQPNSHQPQQQNSHQPQQQHSHQPQQQHSHQSATRQQASHFGQQPQNIRHQNPTQQTIRHEFQNSDIQNQLQQQQKIQAQIEEHQKIQNQQQLEFQRNLQQSQNNNLNNHQPQINLQNNQQSHQNNAPHLQNSQHFSQHSSPQVQHNFNQFSQPQYTLQNVENHLQQAPSIAPPGGELIPSLSKFEQHISVPTAETTRFDEQNYQFRQQPQREQENYLQHQKYQQQGQKENQQTYNQQQQNNQHQQSNYQQQKQQEDFSSAEEYNRNIKQQLETRYLQNNNNNNNNLQGLHNQESKNVHSALEAIQKSIEQNQYTEPQASQKEQEPKQENVEIYASPKPNYYQATSKPNYYQSTSKPDYYQTTSKSNYYQTTSKPNYYETSSKSNYYQTTSKPDYYQSTTKPNYYQSTNKPTQTTTKPNYVFVTSAKTTTTTEETSQSTTTKDPKILEAQLPDEVPEELRQQLLSSGILDHASISVLDYDKVGDIPLSALPPDQLANFYNAGGAQQISSGSAPVPSIVKKPEQTDAGFKYVDNEEDQDMEGSDIDEVKVKQGVEMKVVRYDPQTSQGRQVQESYVRDDATQVEPVVLNGEQYNRYLPLKINGTQFPIPDVPELKGKQISSVVVLAPVTYDFSVSQRKTRDARENSSEPELIQGGALKELLDNPTLENFKKFLESENRTSSDRQSVILLVTGSPASKDKEIFMYDIATQTVNKLNGDLSAAFVEAAEANAKENERPLTEKALAASSIIETRIPFSSEATFNDDNNIPTDIELEAVSSDAINSKVPIIDPLDVDIERRTSDDVEEELTEVSEQKSRDQQQSTIVETTKTTEEGVTKELS